MKKILRLTLLLIYLMLFLMAMTGCKAENLIDENKPTVVCTGFAQYDWVINILGEEKDSWNVIRLNDKGADMHSYQPSARDMIILNQADLVIYTGGMSEKWVMDAIADEGFMGTGYALLDNAEPICIEEEHGHKDDDEHEHEHGHTEHDHDEYDEHVWLSIENAKVYCKDIAILLDTIHTSAAYEENCNLYLNKLEKLADQYESVFNENNGVAAIFADRFPFRYLARDYGLTWYAAFPGCSAETEASFDTIKELANMVTVNEPKAVFITETGTDALARTVIENSEYSKVEILEVNSMQSISSKTETTYIEIMENNLEIIKKGLL